MPRFAANLSMMYPDLPFLDRFEAAAADGFKAVEFLFPYAFDKTELAARLKANVGRAVGARPGGAPGPGSNPVTAAQVACGAARRSFVPVCSSPLTTPKRWIARVSM